jgi:hypothetical protein
MAWQPVTYNIKLVKTVMGQMMVDGRVRLPTFLGQISFASLRI